MNITLVYPFVDIRDFLNYDTYRIKFTGKNFFKPNKKLYIRHFGKIGRYSFKYKYCIANRAIRAIKNEKTILGRKSYGFIPSYFSRKLYIEDIICRYEFSCSSIDKTNYYKHPLKIDEFFYLIYEFLDFQLTMPVLGEESKDFKLFEIGHKLAQLYHNATTFNDAPSNIKNNELHIKSGNPCMIVEFNKNELSNQLRKIKDVKTIYKNIFYGIEIHFMAIYIPVCTPNRDDKIVNTWFIEKSPKKENYFTKEWVMNLKSNIIKNHTQQECIKRVLCSISDNQINPYKGNLFSDRLQQYLNDTTKILQKEKYYGVPFKEISEYSCSFDDLRILQEREDILECLQGIRGNILKKVENFIISQEDKTNEVTIINSSCYYFAKIVREGDKNMVEIKTDFGKNSTFYGPVIIGKNISKCFNSINSIKPKNKEEENLKDKLNELTNLVNKLCQEIPEKEGKQVSNDLNTLVSEVTEIEVPRKPNLILAANGILDGAKKCLDIFPSIESVIETIKSIFNI